MLKLMILASLMAFSAPLKAIKDAKEIDCLAKNIYHESRGEGFIGMLAVAQTTRNRVDADKFPNTYCKVVYQPNQFAWTRKNIGINTKDSSWAESKEIATIVYYFDLPIDITEGATYFHSGKDKPYWTKKFKKTARINNHTFYKP